MSNGIVDIQDPNEDFEVEEDGWPQMEEMVEDVEGVPDVEEEVAWGASPVEHLYRDEAADSEIWGGRRPSWSRGYAPEAEFWGSRGGISGDITSDPWAGFEVSTHEYLPTEDRPESFYDLQFATTPEGMWDLRNAPLDYIEYIEGLPDFPGWGDNVNLPSSYGVLMERAEERDYALIAPDQMDFTGWSERDVSDYIDNYWSYNPMAGKSGAMEGIVGEWDDYHSALYRANENLQDGTWDLDRYNQAVELAKERFTYSPSNMFNVDPEEYEFSVNEMGIGSFGRPEGWAEQTDPEVITDYEEHSPTDDSDGEGVIADEGVTAPLTALGEGPTEPNAYTIVPGSGPNGEDQTYEVNPETGELGQLVDPVTYEAIDQTQDVQTDPDTQDELTDEEIWVQGISDGSILPETLADHVSAARNAFGGTGRTTSSELLSHFLSLEDQGFFYEMLRSFVPEGTTDEEILNLMYQESGEEPPDLPTGDPIDEGDESIIDEGEEVIVDEGGGVIVDEVDEVIGGEVDEPIIDEVDEPIVDEVDEPIVDEVDEPIIDEVDEPIGAEVDEPIIDEVDEVDQPPFADTDSPGPGMTDDEIWFQGISDGSIVPETLADIISISEGTRYDSQWLLNSFNEWMDGGAASLGYDNREEALLFFIGSLREYASRNTHSQQNLGAMTDEEIVNLMYQEAGEEPPTADEIWFEDIESGLIQPETLADYFSVAEGVRIDPHTLLRDFQQSGDPDGFIENTLLEFSSVLPPGMTGDELIDLIYEEAGARQVGEGISSLDEPGGVMGDTTGVFQEDPLVDDEDLVGGDVTGVEDLVSGDVTGVEDLVSGDVTGDEVIVGGDVTEEDVTTGPPFDPSTQEERDALIVESAEDFIEDLDHRGAPGVGILPIEMNDEEWFESVSEGWTQLQTLADHVSMAAMGVGGDRMNAVDLIGLYEEQPSPAAKTDFLQQLRSISAIPEDITDGELIDRMYQEAGQDSPLIYADTGDYGTTGDFAYPGEEARVDAVEVEGEEDLVWIQSSDPDTLGGSFAIENLDVGDVYDEETGVYSLSALSDFTLENFLEVFAFNHGLDITDPGTRTNILGNYPNLAELFQKIVELEFDATYQDVLDIFTDPDEGLQFKGVMTEGFETDPSVLASYLFINQQKISDWIDAGTQGWTPDDWKAYEDLTRDSAYDTDQFSTLDILFDAVIEQMGFGDSIGAAFKNDPRFWDIINNILPMPRNEGQPLDVDSLPTWNELGDYNQSAKDALYDLVSSGPKRSYELDPVIEEIPGTGESEITGWEVKEEEKVIDDVPDRGTEDEDWARLDFLEDMLANAGVNVEMRDLVANERHINEFRQKLRFLGLDSDFINEITDDLLARIGETDSGLIVDDEVFMDFMNANVQVDHDGRPVLVGDEFGTRERLDEIRHGISEEEEEDEETDEEKAVAWAESQGIADFDYYQDSPDYIDWIYSQHYDEATGTYSLTDEAWAEIERATENLGNRRPTAPGEWDEDPPPEDSKYLESAYGGVSGVGDINDPFAMAGHGLYAPGRMFGSDVYESQSPFGALWSLADPQVGELEDISDEEIALFTKADDYFTYLREDAISRNLWEEGEAFDAYTYFEALSDDPTITEEELAELERNYQYYGNIWEDIAPRYYPDAQRAAMQYYGTPDQEKLGDELAQQLLPYAPVFADYLNRQGITGPDGGPIALNDVIALLSSQGMSGLAPPADVGAGGQTTGGGGTSGIGSDVSVNQGTAAGSASIDSTAVTTGAVGVGSTQATEDVDAQAAAENATQETVEASAAATNNANQAVNFNPGLPTGYSTMFTDPGEFAGTNTSRRKAADSIFDSAKKSSGFGGRPGISSASDIYVPNFVMDAQAASTGSVSPLSWWLGRSSDDKNQIKAWVASDHRGMGYKDSNEALEENVYRNADGDLYRVEDEITNFYLPTWAAELAYSSIDQGGSSMQEEVFGEYIDYVPTYSWWQSIGAERRAELQERMINHSGKESTKLVAIRKMEVDRDKHGKDVAFVSSVKKFNKSSGELVPEWETLEELDKEINTELKAEPVRFTDFVKWMIDEGGIDPLSWVNGTPGIGSSDDHPHLTISSDRAVFGLEQLIPTTNPRRPYITATGGWGWRILGQNWEDSWYTGVGGRGLDHSPVIDRTKLPEGGWHSPFVNTVHYEIPAGQERTHMYGAAGAVSRTMLNYFLKHWDSWVGEENSRKVPWPVGVSESDARSVSINRNVDHLTKTEGRRGHTSGRSSTPSIPGKLNLRPGVELFQPQFETVSVIDDFGDIGKSDQGLFEADLDEFFSHLFARDPETNEYLANEINMIDFEGEYGDQPESVWDYSGRVLQTDGGLRPQGRPLYYDDQSSKQGMWAILSSYMPYYEGYLQSYDIASRDLDTPSFEVYMNSGDPGKRPEFDPTDILGSEAAALAFQQNAKVSYGDFVHLEGLMPDWSGGRIVRPNVDYFNDTVFLDGFRWAAPGGEENEFIAGQGVPRPMFYYGDMTDRLDGPTPLGQFSTAQSSGPVIPGHSSGGIVDINYQEGGMVEEEISEDISEDISPLSSQEELEDLVSQDPLLQELMGALMEDSPEVNRLIKIAVDRYGEAIVKALSRLVQQNVGRRSSYIPGPDPGMADTKRVKLTGPEGLPSLGSEEAAISHGEFVVPADVVAHLGDGNNENGAEKLYGMMDRVRETKTGNREQPGEIVEEEVLPV